jgi:hypothetical protein
MSKGDGNVFPVGGRNYLRHTFLHRLTECGHICDGRFIKFKWTQDSPT